MKMLSRLTMGSLIVGYLFMASGCVVAPDRAVVHDERWCADHPRQC